MHEMFMKIAMSQSHMIRKPLANILELLNLLADLPVTDEVKQLIDMLDESALVLDMLVKEVLKTTGISGEVVNYTVRISRSTVALASAIIEAG